MAEDDDDDNEEEEDETEDDEAAELEKNLYFSVSKNNLLALQRLVENGASVNTIFDGMNQLSKSLLHLACEKGHAEVAQFLVNKGAWLNKRDGWLQTPLHYAVCTERSDMVQLMIDAGCNLNAQDRFGKGALHYAVSREETTCLRMLIGAGADLDMQDSNGQTALYLAVTKDGNAETLDCLVKAGSDVNICNHREKRGPLHCAILHPKEDDLLYAGLLLDARAMSNVVDAFAFSPFMSIMKRSWKDGAHVSKRDLQMAQLFVSHNFPVNMISFGHSWFQYRGTALKMAMERGATELVELLLCAGANPDLYGDVFDTTAQDDWLAQECASKLDIIKVYVSNRDGKIATPLMHAILKNNLEIAKLLIGANCALDVTAQIKQGENYVTTTIFEYCVMREQWDFAEIFVYAGYDLRNEDYLLTNENVPSSLVLNLDFWSWLLERLANPLPLTFICSNFLRRFLGRPTHVKVNLLPLPEKIKCDILLKNT